MPSITATPSWPRGSAASWNSWPSASANARTSSRPPARRRPDARPPLSLKPFQAPRPPMTRTPWLAYGCLALSTSLIGSYVGLSKLLVAAFPVFLLAWLRFGMAAVLMAGWLRRGADEAPLDTRTRWLLFVESFLGNFLFSICLLFGLKLSSAVVAGVIMAGIPAAVALMSWLALGEKIAPRVLAGIALGVSGIATVALGKDDGGASTSALGAALLLGAVFCEASY